MISIDRSLSLPAHQDRTLIEVIDGSGRAEETYTYRRVRVLRDRLAQGLTLPPGTRVGLVAGNTPAWVVADLALLAKGLVEVPVPLAFSAEQAVSLLRDTEICLVDVPGARRLREWGLDTGRIVLPIDLDELAGAAGGAPHGPAPSTTLVPASLSYPTNPDDVIKVIHTSGTTGTPKGVRIRAAGIEAVVDSLATVIPDDAFQRYLSLVPLSLLIEQITAVYLPVRTGGTLVLLPPGSALLGTAGARAEDALEWMRGARATGAVLPPAVVSALDKAALKEGEGAAGALFATPAPPFLMAGGAAVDPEALRRLGARGIDVHEGYGLSENSSVVAWNRPGEIAPGTVGRPLPHCEVRLSEDGELLVTSSSLFAGYTVEDPTSRPVRDGWLHTGDRASIDEAGRITILGRLKNVIITSHGRNVSPEWVEGRLRSCRQVRECVVFGDALEHLVALVLTEADADPDLVRGEVLGYAAQHLAETDRPERVVVVADGPELRALYFTVTGRPRRHALFADLVSAHLS
ncbi:AMP-binding protein [Streptomyces sp. NPDC091266]|uniref:AMP-binding protein n=1 Tax=Streptomyces sp. NPDC091266 TaxID=3365978 RepID=UPI003824C367